jgi:hypothetical protein
MKIGVARTSVASISETWVRRITNPEQISAIRVKEPPGGVPVNVVVVSNRVARRVLQLANRKAAAS